MLLRDFASYLRELGSNPDLHIVNRSDASGDESGAALAPAEPKVTPGTLVEDSELRAIQIGNWSESHFTHFLDGIERTHLPCYWSTAPTLYGYTAAVIRGRNLDRKMGTWRSDSKEKLYFPFNRIDPTDIRSRGIQAQDISEIGEQPDEHPAAMLDKARKAVGKVRAGLESRLAREWIAEYGGNTDCWLVIDGSLTEVVDSGECGNVIGIIKSHQTQYFDLEQQRKILALNPGERSSVFCVRGWKGREIYSWYLRLHSNAGRDIYFGLVRIEAAPTNESVQMADDISRWLMAERAPLSLPDTRWDRLIYPIRDCEMYLRSLAPTRVMLGAAFSGI